MNEWVCVTGQYEKALLRIGRDLYRAHQDRKLFDQDAVEMCYVLEGIFLQAKCVREELKFDLRSAVARNSKAKNAHVGQAKRKVGGFVSRRVLDFWDHLNIPKYKEAAGGTIMELSNRALSCADRGEPLIDSADHLKMCELALALEKECQRCWERLGQLKEDKQNNKGLSVSALTVQMIVGVGQFAKKSKHGKRVLKILKYNETVEKAKLLGRFVGRPEELALRRQMDLAPA